MTNLFSEIDNPVKKITTKLTIAVIKSTRTIPPKVPSGTYLTRKDKINKVGKTTANTGNMTRYIKRDILITCKNLSKINTRNNINTIDIMIDTYTVL